MPQPDYNKARNYIILRLENELSEELYYHDIYHTTRSVLPAAERLAKLCGIGQGDLLLLKTAILYHDAGYIEQYSENEPIGAAIAAQHLPDFGYTDEQIEVIQGLILATRMPQSPSTLLEQIICDADLDSLGRNDFFIHSEKLRLELLSRGNYFSLRDWYEIQIEFLQSHSYFTQEAHELRDKGKQDNLEEMLVLLGIV